MAVNILIRRGTAAEWTASNPILLEAEVGLETDTKKLKVGDGLTVWASLPYINLTPAAAASTYAPIANPTFTGVPAAPTATSGTNTTQVATTAFVTAAVNSVIDSAPGALNTLDELAAALGDDANFAGSVTNSLALKAPLASPTFTGLVSGVTKSMVGLGNVDNTSDANKPISTATQTALDLKATQTALELKAPLASPTFTGSVAFDTGVALIFEGATADGFETTLAVADPTADRTLTLPNSTGTLATQEHVASELGTHTADTTSVHGIADTAELATKSYADTSVNTHSSDTTDVHGIADTANLATKTYADTAVSTHSSDTTDVHGIANTSLLATTTDITTHSNDTTSVHGIADTADLATKSYADTAAANAVSTSLGTHEADTLSVHGIADTSLLVTTTGTQTLSNKTITTPAGLTKNDVGLGNVDNTSDLNKPVSTATQTALDLKASISAIAELAQDAVNTAVVAGVGLDKVYDDEANTITLDIDSTVATKTYADGAVSTHSSDTTSVHGITDTAERATKAYTDSAVSTHTSDTTAVHGITDTSLLVTTTASQTLTNKTLPTPLGLVKSDVGLGNVDNTADASKPVSTAQQTALDLKANLSGPTFTGTVSGITKSMVGLGNVDDTTDANKPVSTAQQTALDLKETVANVALKAPLASPALTGVPTAPTAAAATNTTQIATTAYVRAEVAALVNSAGATLDTLGEIATALGNDANLSTTLTTAIGLKAPIASPTFTGTVTIPSGASIAGFAPLASPTFTGTNNVAALTASGLITASASGIAFTDGTQTVEGVPSRTPIIQKTASYTLSALTERDTLIEVSSASGTTITIPLNSAVAFPVGTSIDILQTSTGQVTIAGSGGVTINSTPGLKLRTQWSTATLFKRAENTWVVYGDLTA